MRLGSEKYRNMQAELDKEGIVTCINRVGPKRYQMIEGFEVKKEYRQRASCNRYITRLYNTKIKTNG